MDTSNPGSYEKFDTGFRYHRVLNLTKDGDAYFVGSGYARFPCIARFNINTKQVSTAYSFYTSISYTKIPYHCSTCVH